MSLLTQTHRLLSTPTALSVAQKRFNVRERIHRYVEPNKFKKHMLAACEPYMKREFKIPEETCKGTPLKVFELHPLERILVNELLEDMKNCNTILFIQHNYSPFYIERVHKNTIIKIGCKFHTLNNNIYKETFKILGIDRAASLFIGRNALITTQVDKLPACLRALKKMPQLLLLAGVIDGHLHEVDLLNSISATSNIDQCRANLVGTLSSPAINLSAYLEQHKELIEPREQINPE